MGGRLFPPQSSMQMHTLCGLTHTQCGTHTFVRCIPKSCTLGTRILCSHKSLKNFSTQEGSRRGRTCRRVRTDMTQSQHAPMYYTACAACRTPQWAAQYTLHTQNSFSSLFSPTTMCNHVSHCMQDTTVSCTIQCIYFKTIERS